MLQDFWYQEKLPQAGHCRRHVDCSGSPINLHWIPSFCWAFHSVHCTFRRQRGPLARGMLCRPDKQRICELFNYLNQLLKTNLPLSLNSKCLHWHNWLETLEQQTVPPSDELRYCRCHLVKQMVSDARSDITTHLLKTYCTLKVTRVSG